MLIAVAVLTYGHIEGEEHKGKDAFWHIYENRRHSFQRTNENRNRNGSETGDSCSKYIIEDVNRGDIKLICTELKKGKEKGSRKRTFRNIDARDINKEESSFSHIDVSYLNEGDSPFTRGH